MTMFRRIVITLLLAVALLPLSAQEKGDTAFVFRFVADTDKDMFFSPYNGNGEEQARLTACIDRNRAAIESGQKYLRHDRQCQPNGSHGGGHTPQPREVETYHAHILQLVLAVTAVSYKDFDNESVWIYLS